MKISWRRHPIYQIFLFLMIIVLLWGAFHQIRKMISTEINMQHTKIEAELSRKMNQPIKIETIKLKWSGFTPSLLLKHIQILDPKTQKVSLNVGYLNLTPAIFESIRRWQLIPAQLNLEKIKLTLKQLPNSSWKIQELNYLIQADSASSFSIQSLIRLISLPNVEVRNIYLDILPLKKSSSVHVKANHIQVNIDPTWQKIYLHTEGLSLNLPGVKESLPDLSLSTQLQLVFGQTNVQQVMISKLNLINSDFHFHTDGKIELGNSLSDVILNLKGNFSFLNLEKFSKYAPSSLVDAELSDWFHQAFLSGQIEDGEFEWQGALSEFPYDQGKGFFKVILPVRQVDLHFAPSWPLLEVAKGQIKLTGRALYIAVDEAKLNQIPVSGIQAWIPYLGDDKPQILEVRMPNGIHTNLDEAINYIRQSPLQEKFGKYFDGASTNGAIQLQLSLTVPLRHPDHLTLLGNLQLHQNQFSYPKWHVAFDQLTGEILFSEKTISSKNLKALYYQEPATLTIGNDLKNSKLIRMTLDSLIHASSIEKIIKQPLQNYLTGQTPFHAEISFSEKDPLKIMITSNLDGMKIQFKNFIDKAAQIKKDFNLSIQSSLKSEWIVGVQYSDVFGFVSKFKTKNDEWTPYAMILQLGKKSLPTPSGSGLSIVGVLPELNLSKMTDLFSNSEKSSITLEKANILVGKLKWGSQDFLNTRLSVSSTNQYWNVQLRGNDLAGSVQIPNTILSSGNSGFLTAKLSVLHLKTSSSNENDSLKFNQIPSFKLNIQDFSIDQRALGELDLSVLAEKDKLRIAQLQVKSKHSLFVSEGKWDARGTHLIGKLTSININQLLKDLQFSLKTFDAKQGNLDFNLFWKNSPLNLKWFNASGKLNLEITNGRVIPENSATGAKMDFGKLLNLLSLQSLPKRLTLDFSDVFQSGYHFDRLSGDFSLNNGIAKVSDLNFKGALANIKIQGEVGLVKKTYRLLIAVTPQVTASIPVAATLVTGQPLIGLGAWVANKVLSKQVSQVAASHYWVSGAWENPQWQSISESQAQQMIKSSR